MNTHYNFDRDHSISLPASKSIGARFLMASFFAGSLHSCRDFNDCEDLTAIQKALNTLQSGDSGTRQIDVSASGTAFRFMAAAIASTPGADFVLTGTQRLCSRPMSPLLSVLRRAGAVAEAYGNGDAGPYHIKGRRLKGGDFEIRGDISSQFISALMLAAPSWERGMKLTFTTPLVSRPYVEMTAGIMTRFGISVRLCDDFVEVKNGKYAAPDNFNVEPDWSAASYFYASQCFAAGCVSIAGLLPPDKSLQGDSALVKFFKKLGVYSGFAEEGAIIYRGHNPDDHVEFDLTHNPDLMPALAVGCLLQSTRFKFTGVRNLRLKESDRLLAMKTEIEKLGYPIAVGDDFIEWRGGACPVGDTVLETYDDHRIAMAMAIMARHGRDIRLANPDVVRKSFPGFWDELPKIGLECHPEGNVMRVTRF